MTEMLRIKNWAKFQHYKDRDPEWIKLHVKLMQSEDWVLADDATKLLMVICLMIAAKKKGLCPNDANYIKRIGQLHRKPNLTPLIECGFLEIVQADASEMQQNASLEKSREEKSREDDDEDSPAHVSRETPEALRHDVGDIAFDILGVKDDPRWFGNYSLISAWLSAGYDPDLDIFPTLRSVMAKRNGTGPPGSLNYFTKAVAQAFATRTSPLPPGEIQRSPHGSKPNHRNGFAEALGGYAGPVGDDGGLAREPIVVDAGDEPRSAHEGLGRHTDA